MSVMNDSTHWLDRWWPLLLIFFGVLFVTLLVTFSPRYWRNCELAEGWRRSVWAKWHLPTASGAGSTARPIAERCGPLHHRGTAIAFVEPYLVRVIHRYL